MALDLAGIRGFVRLGLFFGKVGRSHVLDAMGIDPHMRGSDPREFWLELAS